MSLFRFITAEHPLPEVDYSGFMRLKVKDILKMNPMPKSPLKSWDEFDPESEVLYAEHESDLGGLHVKLCTNPPRDLPAYTQKPYIYWLEGNLHLDKCRQQLYAYLQELSGEAEGVELCSIWFGDGLSPLEEQHVSLADLRMGHLEGLRDRENRRIRLTLKSV